MTSPTFAHESERDISTLELPLEGAPPIKIKLGYSARQADVSLWVEHGEARLLVTLTIGAKQSEADFCPLTVDYYERSSALGRIPGNYQRREIRQSDEEIRLSRLIDRAIRPLINSDERREIHLCVQLLSADTRLDLVGLALTVSGLAVQCSPLSFGGPIMGASLRIEQGTQDGTEEPTWVALRASAKEKTSWYLAFHANGVVMLEGGGARQFVPAGSLMEAFKAYAQTQRSLFDQLEQFVEEVAVKRDDDENFSTHEESAEISDCTDDLRNILRIQDKRQREIKYSLLLSRQQDISDQADYLVARALWSQARDLLRSDALAGIRQDGRAAHEIRTYDFESHVLPRSNGSCLVSRGRTAVLVSVTTGKGGEAPMEESLFNQGRPDLFCHYHFPGYATHQSRHGRAPNRREIGHGVLVQRSLNAVVPKVQGHCLRVVADVLEADGSSSMASIIGANLALAESGYPLQCPLVGVSVGLVTNSDRSTGVLLLDITGDEDFYGDMDLKVVGGAEGICTVQLDNKLGALPWDVIETALLNASEVHGQLIPLITERVNTFAPAEPAFTKELSLDADRLGHVIGPRGAHVKEVQRTYQVNISIDRATAVATISGEDEDLLEAAIVELMTLNEPLKNGHIYFAKIEDIKEFGVFVRFAQHRGLVHISELRQGGGDAREHYEVGEELLVKLLGFDRKGRLKLSHLAAK